jgi:hypothetical protein
MQVTCYARFCNSVPDIFAGLWPASFNRSAAERWKLWIADTHAERQALEEALAQPVPFQNDRPDFRRGPDLLNSAPSRGEAFIALYPPPAPEWPWITLRSMPGSPIGYRHRYVWAFGHSLAEAGAHFRTFAEADPKAVHFLPSKEADR